MILSPSESTCTDGGRSIRSYTVSFDDGTGIRHRLHVTAQTLFEAAARALRIFEGAGTPPGPAAHLEIAAQTPIVNHSVTVQRVRDWLTSGGKTPKEQALKSRLRVRPN
jgi:hypothetical protein